MNRIPFPALGLALALVLTAGVGSATAADEAWRLKVSGVSAQSTAGAGSSGPAGVGLGLEYRATPRLGVELGGLRSDVDDDELVEFFLPGLDFQTEFRMTPVLARLNLHLTPDRRADLYLGPVAGYVSMSDVEVRVRAPGGRFEPGGTLETEDRFTWGAHLGLDVRLGAGSSFVTAGATYLDLDLELDRPFDGPTVNSVDPNLIPLPVGGEVDPLVFHLGYSYRF